MQERYILDALRGLARVPWRAHEPKNRYFWPLREVSFEVRPGETLGIVGENGAGKSTLLKVIARILEPTFGAVEVNGRVAALLELGAGFHPDLTGRENIYLNSSILGLPRKEVRRYIDKIIEFADIGPFIDSPVKHYSSGMRVRLGFSVAIHVRPDILLVDEVIAVGDENFQHKCVQAFSEFCRNGGSLVLVSHSLDQVRVLCERAMWLHIGQIQADGPAGEVIDRYLRDVHAREEQQIQHATAQSAAQAQSQS